MHIITTSILCYENIQHRTHYLHFVCLYFTHSYVSLFSFYDNIMLHYIVSSGTPPSAAASPWSSGCLDKAISHQTTNTNNATHNNDTTTTTNNNNNNNNIDNNNDK